MLNPFSVKGAFHHATFMGNWPTIIHVFLALSTQWMSFPSSKLGRMVNPRFHLVVFVFGVNQLKWGLEGAEGGGRRSPIFINDRELLHRPSSYRKLLDRDAFRILSNINDGVPL